MDDQFISDLCAFLGYPEETRQKLEDSLQKTLFFNLSTTLLSFLPEEKRKSLAQIVKENPPSKLPIQQWITEQQFSQDPHLATLLAETADRTYQDFFLLLMKDMDAIERFRLLDYARKYT